MLSMGAAPVLFLLSLETFHIVGHMVILLRILLPQRSELRRNYFFVDGITPCFSALCVDGPYWLALSHMIFHMYFYITWHWPENYTQHVLDWSAMEWCKVNKGKLDLGFGMGTGFDIIVHSVYTGRLFLTLDLPTACACVLVGLFFGWYGTSGWKKPKYEQVFKEEYHDIGVVKEKSKH